MVRSLGLILSAALVLTGSAAAATPKDYGKNLFDILPPGQAGVFPPVPNSTDQAKLYDALTPLFDQVTAADIPKYFKSSHFGVDGPVVKTEHPRKGLTIQRDTYGVPHIYGKTRADVMFGSGWATAQDRSLFIETIRGPARIASVDPPGLDALTIATQLRQFQPTAATEKFIGSQAKLVEKTKAGRALAKDVDDYVAGINAWYRKSKNAAKPWTRTDVIAVTALLGQTFGRGGGQEIAAARLLGALQAKLGADTGFNTWRDLRRLDDPEAPTNTTTRFPYMTDPGKIGPGAAVVDPAATAAAVAGGLAPTPPRQLMSNALLVGKSRSATGHPLGVIGAQLGYYYPMLFLELDLHGGGFDARGGVLPGVPYVLLGHGKDYAWDATSGASDLMDQFLEQLCNRDGSAPTAASTSYVYKGKCRPMTTFDAGVLKGGNLPDQQVKFNETVHGPVAGVVTVGGKPYAVANARSTRGREFASAAAILDFNRNVVHSAKDFLRSAAKLEYTFNLFYIDNKDIAWYHACRCPIRAPGTYPGLPTLGTGEYDWRGFLTSKQHPQAINPPSGVILDWNSKPAPGWGAADDNWAYGSVQRKELFTGLTSHKDTLADVVASMNRAATQDIKPVEVWPLIAQVLAGGPAPDAATQQAANLVTTWAAAGASRLDRDLDGKIDDPGAAVLDRAWPRIADAVMTPGLGTDIADQLAKINTRDQVAHSGGSSYFQGWYEYVDKDLRTLLGQPVQGPFSRRYCGNGDLNACREALWGAIKATADQLTAEQGADPASWRSDATGERIAFKPGLLQDTMRWANRTSFQQVVEFGGHRKR
jgi:acyl-homoserine lactone acylase PvdQ